MILQADPKAGYLAQRRDIDAAMARVAASGWYILGQEVAGFEREFGRVDEFLAPLAGSSGEQRADCDMDLADLSVVRNRD